MESVPMRVPHLALSFAAVALLLPGLAGAQDHSAHHAGHATLACATPRGNVAERPSPYDSISTMVGNTMAKVCYGRPSARGRQFVGHDAHPFGEPWRFGANEATAIHLSAPATIAGVRVNAGSYSLYAIPGAQQWQIVVNGNAARWGIPISPEVRAADVGSGTVTPEALAAPVETFTLRFEPAGSGEVHLVGEWEGWRVRIPVRSAGN
jgi:hypothetical protein